MPGAEGAWQRDAAPALTSGAVHVCKAFWPDFMADLPRLESVLSADERSRASRFHQARDRQRFIVAHGLLRLLLGHYLTRPAAAIRFAHNAFGKPSVVDSGGLEFNLSHAGDLVLYAFACRTEIGVDVEVVQHDFPAADIAHDYFSPAEIAVLDSLPDNLKARAFFDCWTRKEAWIKARSQGLSIPLDSFDVAFAPDAPARLLATRGEPAEAGAWSLFDVPPAPGYAGALAIRGHGWRLALWECAPSAAF